MKIKSLELENFKNIDRIELSIENLNLISGDNGSGKSSILQAIQYALTDSLPEKLSEYIKWGKDYFKITIKFEHGGEEYIYKIKYASTSSKELLVGETEYKNSEASKKIKEIVNSDLLLYSCFSEQGNSYSILTESPAERLKRFKSILGIDRLSSIVEYSKEEYKLKKAEAESIDKELKILKNRTFSYLEEIPIPDIEDIKNQFSIQEKEKEEKEKYDSLKREWEKKDTSYKDLISRKTSIDTNIESIKKKLFEMKLVEFNNTEYQSLLDKKNTLLLEEQQFKAKVAKYEGYINQVSQLTIQINDLKSKKESIKMLRLVIPSATKEELNKFIDYKTSLTVSLSTVTKHIELAKQGKCSSCGQDFVHSIDDLVLEKKRVEEDLSSIISIISKVEKEWMDYDLKSTQNKLNQTRISEYNDSIESLQIKLQSLEKVEEPIKVEFNIDYINSQIKELLTIKMEYDKQEEQSKVFKIQLLKYEGELQSLESLIQQSNPGPAPIQERRFLFNNDLYEKLKQEIIIHNQKLNELRRIREYNKKIEEEEIKAKDEIKQKDIIYYSIQNEIKILEDAKNILEKQFSGYLIERGTKFIESQMNSFFQKCYNRYSVYFKQTDNKKSIDFYYTDFNSERITSAALCSGFEKQLLSIAFRVALASITGLGFLILDEIDSDASDENSKALYSNLIESGLFNQIICITHHEVTKQSLINDYNAGLISL